MLSAEYFCSGSVSKESYGHYGLASPIYTHFTVSLFHNFPTFTLTKHFGSPLFVDMPTSLRTANWPRPSITLPSTLPFNRNPMSKESCPLSTNDIGSHKWQEGRAWNSMSVWLWRVRVLVRKLEWGGRKRHGSLGHSKMVWQCLFPSEFFFSFSVFVHACFYNELILYLGSVWRGSSLSRRNCIPMMLKTTPSPSLLHLVRLL